jgi:inosose dehydratase
MQRRKFIQSVPLLTSLPSVVRSSSLPISCNNYNWHTFFKREGRIWGADKDYDISQFVQSGITAIEPNIESIDMGRSLIEVLKKHKISMPSIYVNSVLHDEKEVDKSIKHIISIADLAKSYGTSILVTNPSPISWGGKENKSDTALVTQAKALNLLGSELRKKGIRLAYHTHDMEMRAGAREFHHMLQNTSPLQVGFCFDTHWVFRGSENSQAAVFDVLKMYGSRIVELHLRQSINGIWSETFTATGDIDYHRFAIELTTQNIKPHIVIEQCIEDKSPNTMTAIEAHRIDLKNIITVFNKLIR